METVLNLLSDHGGRLPESELTETWLPKLGLKEKDTLPGLGTAKASRPPPGCRGRPRAPTPTPRPPRAPAAGV